MMLKDGTVCVTAGSKGENNGRIVRVVKFIEFIIEQQDLGKIEMFRLAA